jgi:SAM-dependent methyltransferase
MVPGRQRRPVASSAIYDRLAGCYGVERNRHFYSGILDELVCGGDMTLRGRGLDLACGAGLSTAPLRRAFAGIEWLGLDRSRPMLTQLRGSLDVSGVPVVQADAESLPIASRSLRLVACSFAVHWMEPAVWPEIARVLTADGRLLLAAPLRTPAPGLPGNRWLGRALLAERRSLYERPRAGLTVSEIESTLVAWRIQSLRVVTFAERYPSGAALLEHLATRGVLAALFGARAEAGAMRLRSEAAPVPVEFGWPVALVTASPPPAQRCDRRAT